MLADGRLRDATCYQPCPSALGIGQSARERRGGGRRRREDALVVLLLAPVVGRAAHERERVLKRESLFTLLLTTSVEG